MKLIIVVDRYAMPDQKTGLFNRSFPIFQIGPGRSQGESNVGFPLPAVSEQISAKFRHRSKRMNLFKGTEQKSEDEYRGFLFSNQMALDCWDISDVTS
jgi:hypothetical protein